jgi:RNA-splicing ligase RtcB
VIHHGDLAGTDVTTHEGLPVTTVAKSVLHVVNETGRLGLARQAIKDARREGHISASEAKRLTRQLNEHHRGDGKMQAAKEHPTAYKLT